MNSQLFEIVDFMNYKNNTHVSCFVKANVNCTNTNIPIMHVLINKQTGQINFTKLYESLVIATEKKSKEFLDWRSLINTGKYLDKYSLIKYSQPYHLIHDKKRHIYETDKELIVEDVDSTKIMRIFVNSSKITHYDDMEPRTDERQYQVLGDMDNTSINTVRGFYGEITLIPKMMSYLSNVYELISVDLVLYVKDLIDNLRQINIDNVLQDSDVVKSDDQIVKKSFMNENDVILKQLNSRSPSKGKIMEKEMSNYIKNWFPDLENCSKETSACDLVSRSRKTRFEITCHKNPQKFKSGEDKFMTDVKNHMHDTNLFVYIDLSQSSRIETHFDINPNIFYVNGTDLNDSIMNMIYNTSSCIPEHKLSNNENYNSSMSLNDDLTFCRQRIFPFIETMIRERHEHPRNKLHSKDQVEMMLSEHNEAIQNSDQNASVEDCHDDVKTTEVIQPVVQDKTCYEDAIKHYLSDYYDEYVIPFRRFAVGNKTDDISYKHFQEWQKVHDYPSLSPDAFMTTMLKFCFTRRMTIKGCQSQIMSWKLKPECKVDIQKFKNNV